MLEAPPPVQGGDDLWLGTGKINSRLWSEGDNWELGHPPGTADSAIFSGTVNGVSHNNPCEVDSAAAFPIASMILNNTYSAQISIDTSVALEASGGFWFGLGTTANIDFKSTGATASKLVADGGNSAFVGNFNFSDQRGSVIIKSGATLSLQNNGSSESYPDLWIGGTLYADNSGTLTFHGGAGITVASGASMFVEDTDATPLASAGNDGGIIENWGTLGFNGAAANDTTVNMAILNHGDASFDGGHFNIGQSSSATGGYGYKMDDGATTLTGGITLATKSGYYQTGGTLSVGDTTAASILVTGFTNLKAEIDGGNVKLGTANAFGALDIFGGELDFNGGEFDAKINGPKGDPGWHEDYITADGNINIAGQSKLVVTALNGAVAPNNLWTILLAGNGKSVTGNFVNPSLPAGITAAGPFGQKYLLAS